MTVIKEDSLNKRYFYKVATGLIGIPIQFVIALIIPRSLGPVAYGQFNFLTNTFSQIFGFFDSGTSIAYFTKLSSNLNSKEVITYYFRVVFFICLTVLFITSSIILLNLEAKVWPDQQIQFIYLALAWATLVFIAGIINKTVDAYGITVKGEIINLIQKFFGLFIVLGLFIFSTINLAQYFIYHYLIISFLIIGWLVILANNGINLFKLPALTKIHTSSLNKYFWNYSSNLIVYSLFGMIVGILDLWMLQYFSGSFQQGYFGFSYKLAALTFLFSKSLTPLITREFTISFKGGNIKEMSLNFKKYIPILYTITAFITVFISIEAREVAIVFGGKQFEGAVLPIALMTLYPIHQSYGQLSASVFYATGKTKLYRNIGCSMLLFGFFISFYLLAPNTYFGLNLGAHGLAIKILVVQFITVNIQLFYNAKFLALNFRKYLSHQFLVVGTFYLLAYSIKYIISYLIENSVVSFLSCGLIYLVLGVFLIYKFPSLIFATKAEVEDYRTLLIRKLSRHSIE